MVDSFTFVRCRFAPAGEAVFPCLVLFFRVALEQKNGNSAVVKNLRVRGSCSSAHAVKFFELPLACFLNQMPKGR